MKKRSITSLIIVLVVAAMIGCKFLPYTIGTYIFDIFVLIIAMIAAVEMCNIMGYLNKPVNKIFSFIYPIFNFIVLIIALKFSQIYWIFITELISIFAYFVVVLLTEGLINNNSFKDKVKTSFNTIITCLYPSLLFCCMLIINHSDSYFNITNISVVFILLLIAITFLTDSFAFLIGSLLKGPKLAPKISPGKTISGAIGGVLGGIAGAMLVYLLVYNVDMFSSLLTTYNISWWGFLLIGLFGSIVDQLGDLFESFIKRKAQIKDSGNILPGHGGMLDRIDAMTFTAFYLLIVVIILL